MRYRSITDASPTCASACQMIALCSSTGALLALVCPQPRSQRSRGPALLWLPVYPSAAPSARAGRNPSPQSGVS